MYYSCYSPDTQHVIMLWVTCCVIQVTPSWSCRQINKLCSRESVVSQSRVSHEQEWFYHPAAGEELRGTGETSSRYRN